MLKLTRPLAAILILAAAGCTAPPAAQPGPMAVTPATTPAVRYAMCDCHLHLVDFLQHSDGVVAALAAMDKVGVEQVVLSGMPVVKAWPQSEAKKPEYYLDDDSRVYWYSATDLIVARQVLALPADQQKRIHPTICGFNGADQNAVEHVKRMVDLFPGFWQGIGEVMTRHDDLTALTYGEPARADNLALSKVFDFAGEHDLPVFLHSNAGSVWKREPIYLPEVETAIKSHPKTKFIWCHCGISRRIDIPTLTQELDRMLNTYSNMRVDISWVVYETYLLKDGKPNPDWVALIEHHPDRFLIGTDKVGHFADYSKEITKYYVFLDALKPETAKKVAHDNMLSVLPKVAATLTVDEEAGMGK